MQYYSFTTCQMMLYNLLLILCIYREDDEKIFEKYLKKKCLLRGHFYSFNVNKSVFSFNWYWFLNYAKKSIFCISLGVKYLGMQKYVTNLHFLPQMEKCMRKKHQISLYVRCCRIFKLRLCAFCVRVCVWERNKIHWQVLKIPRERKKKERSENELNFFSSRSTIYKHLYQQVSNIIYNIHTYVCMYM